MADDEGVRRRDVLKGLGVTGAVAGIVATAAPPTIQEAEAQTAAHPHAHPAPLTGQSADDYRFFTPAEAAVVVALVDTLIPKDEVGPGGAEAGVPIFIDRELAGAYGRGARMYLDGPFRQGTPQQGYQLPLTIADLYRVGIADLNAWCASTHGGKSFDQLSPADRVAARPSKPDKRNLPKYPRAPSSGSCFRTPWKGTLPIRCTGAIATARCGR
jgi:gluconate 2-dehydrogenase gamma chain